MYHLSSLYTPEGWIYISPRWVYILPRCSKPIISSTWRTTTPDVGFVNRLVQLTTSASPTY